MSREHKKYKIVSGHGYPKNPEDFIVYRPRVDEDGDLIHPTARPITAAEIWALRKSGFNRKEIARKIPYCTKEMVDKAESYMMEIHREEYERVVGPPQAKYNIWLDECMPWRLGSLLHRFGYGRIKSVMLSGIAGTKDPALWGYLIDAGADCIITKDGRDKEAKPLPNGKTPVPQHLVTLGRKSREPSAFAAWHGLAQPKNRIFPLIVVVDHSVPTSDMPKIFKKYRSDIQAHVKNRKEIVYLRLNKNGVSQVYTIKDLKKSALKDQANDAFKAVYHGEGLPEALANKSQNPDYQIIEQENERRTIAIESLKTAVITMALTRDQKITPDLVRYALFIIYGNYEPVVPEAAKTFSQSDQSPAPTQSPERIIPPHRG